MPILRPKVIYDPILQNPIDVDSFIAMVDAPEFQLLRDRRQLGLTDLAFPAARHSRFEHSIGSFAATRRLADRWVVAGIITKDVRRALAAYALYHDIGHAAFSHVTEDFCGDHKVRTCEIVQRLRPTIEKSDVDFELMYALISHQHPLHAAVSDKTIGIEKLDYLERDGWYTGIGLPTGVKYLRKFLYFSEGHICIDEKMVEHVLDTQRFYMQMFKDVYLRKCLVIAQRMFHKMLYYAIISSGLDAHAMGTMTDSDLLANLYALRDHGVEAILRRMRNRDLLKEAVVMRSESSVCETRVVEKLIKVVGLPDQEMNELVRAPGLQKMSHASLQVIELSIARHLRIPAYDVVIVPPLYANRFSSHDVRIYGSDGKMHSLRNRRPRAFESIDETARSYQAVRICVPKEYRARAFDAGDDLAHIVRQLVRT